MTSLQRIKFRMARAPLLWRWGLNFDRTVRHVIDSYGRKPDTKLMEILRRDGIAACKAEEVLDGCGMECLNEAMREVERLLGDDPAPAKATSNPGKDYLTSLLGTEFDLNSPFLKLAIHPFFLNTANAYLGLRSCLRAINVWINRPTPSPPKESQLWHRDGDDRMILKVFIYLADVDVDNGPFWFIPGTHRKRVSAARNPLEPARWSDQDMRSSIADNCWKAYTGPAGTTIFADTTGFHKGGKCDERPRVLLTFQYVSAASPYPREFQLRSNADMRGLDSPQRYALSFTGK